MLFTFYECQVITIQCICNVCTCVKTFHISSLCIVLSQVILSCYSKQVGYKVLIQTNTERLTVVTLTKENNTQLVSAAENQSIHTS